MTPVRIVLQLTLKHLVHHGLAVMGACVLLFFSLTIAVVLAISEEYSTVLSAATGLLYYIGPMFILFVVDRLFARDYQDGTSEFLAALPAPALLRLAVPFVLGALIVVAVCESSLLFTAILASRREGLPFVWFMLVHIQVLAYALAWYAMAFGFVHLGRWRWLAWWGLLNFVVSIDESWVDAPWRRLMWHGVLADPLDHARSLFPLDGLALAIAWSLFGLVLGTFLAVWRGGALPTGWFAPASIRQRAALVAGGVSFMVLGSTLSETGPTPDTWRTLEPLPAEHADIRVAGGATIRAIGTEVSARLDALGAQLGVDSWPQTVLHPARRGLHRHVRRSSGSGASLVLLVDPSGPRESVIRDVMSEVLLRQTGDLASRRPEVELWIRGVAGWQTPDPALERRLAGVDLDLSPTETLDGLGQDVAEAVSAARLQAMPAPTCVLAPLLSTQRGASFFSSVRLRWTTRGDFVTRLCGPPVPMDARPPGDALPMPPLRLRGEGDSWVAHWEWPAPRGTVLRTQVLDPLENRPSLAGVWRYADVSGKSEHHLGLSTGQVVVAELVTFWEPIEGWVSSGQVQR